MPRTRCTVCKSADASAINRRLAAGDSLRSVAAQFDISRSTLSRHVEHARAGQADQTGPVDAPAGSDRHEAAADALVAAFRRQRGAKFTPLDEAEAVQLQSTAAALDADPTNVSLLREFRISLAMFRRAFGDGAPTGPSLAEFLADALANPKGK
jgi:transposase-like protein